ncbi:MAG: hypothetical protein K0Q95_2731 [Bacteroidota bacterium]|jgi:hypothetical protein|nr:hypothetical protein [Bacteroidota bacterium]
MGKDICNYGYPFFFGKFYPGLWNWENAGISAVNYFKP